VNIEQYVLWHRGYDSFGVLSRVRSFTPFAMNLSILARWRSGASETAPHRLESLLTHGTVPALALDLFPMPATKTPLKKTPFLGIGTPTFSPFLLFA
jgi:hypothetical protein